MSHSSPTLASLLGSQVDSFQSSIHQFHQSANKKNTSIGNGVTSNAQLKGKKNNPLTKTLSHAASSSILSPSLAPAANSSTPTPLTLHQPFTHTIGQSSVLSSILTTESTPSVESLVNTLDTAHTLLAQLLPKEVSETPEPKEFHSLFLAYLEACAGNTQSEKKNKDGEDKDEKSKKKRKRDESKEDGSNSATTATTSPIPFSPSIHHTLHTVSTTVIGRLAARCISLLSAGPVSDGPFDAALLQSADSYWSVLWMLLRSDSLSARFTPALFSLLTKHDALPLIECALVHLHDASERDLVEVTKYALNHLPNPIVSEKLLPTDLLGQPSVPQQPTKKKRKKSARSVVTHVSKIQEPVKVVEVPGGPFAVIL